MSLMPWQTEPSSLDWKGPLGYRCAIRRTEHTGTLCGYVVVADWHPWFGRDSSEVGASVHCGLSFSGPELPAPPYLNCLGFWVVGFDTAHHRDYWPAMAATMEAVGTGVDQYRDFAYVREETERLALQASFAAAAARPDP